MGMAKHSAAVAEISNTILRLYLRIAEIDDALASVQV